MINNDAVLHATEYNLLQTEIIFFIIYDGVSNIIEFRIPTVSRLNM